MAKRRLIGTITSVKMHETALVTVDRLKTHPLYGKRYRRSTTFAAHNPGNTYQLADLVEIEEHRPLAKTKHWIIRSRIAAGAADVPEVQQLAEPELVANPTELHQSKTTETEAESTEKELE